METHISQAPEPLKFPLLGATSHSKPRYLVQQGKSSDSPSIIHKLSTPGDSISHIWIVLEIPFLTKSLSMVSPSG